MRAACAQLVMLSLGVGVVHAGDVAGLIAVPKLPLPVLSPLPDSPTSEQVRATVDANRGELRRCYDDWLARHPLRGNTMFVVDVALSISPSGASEQMSLRGLDDQAKLATCIEAELSRWQFPSSQRGADLHVPIVLAGRPRGAAAPGAVSPRALHQAMVAQRASLSSCFATLEGAAPSLSANLSIDASGNTRVAQLRGADRQPALKTCLRDALRAWRFPPSGKTELFAFPL